MLFLRLVLNSKWTFAVLSVADFSTAVCHFTATFGFYSRSTADFYSHGCDTEWAILQPVTMEKNLSFYSRFTASDCRIAMKFTLKPNHFWNSPFIFFFKDPWNMTWNGNAQPIFENFHIFLILRFYIIKVDHWYQEIRKTASLGSHNGAKM